MEQRILTVQQTLSGVQRLGADTSPFIYFVENHPVYAPVMQSIFLEIDTQQIAVVTSVVTLTEVMTRPLSLGLSSLADAYRDYLLNPGIALSLQIIDASLAQIAASLRAQYKLKTPDALQVAAALNTGCSAFLTNVRGLQRITSLQIILLDDITI